jgi:hypothetical protein
MKYTKLLLFFILTFSLSGPGASLGAGPKVRGEKVFEYHNDKAVFFFPIYLPLIAVKFTFYDFPKAGLSLPWRLITRLQHPSYTEEESLIKSLNDPNIIKKEFIIYRLKYLTGQSFGYPGPIPKGQEKEVILQWNQWWEEHQGK